MVKYGKQKQEVEEVKKAVNLATAVKLQQEVPRTAAKKKGGR